MELFLAFTGGFILIELIFILFLRQPSLTVGKRIGDCQKRCKSVIRYWDPKYYNGPFYAKPVAREDWCHRFYSGHKGA